MTAPVCPWHNRVMQEKEWNGKKFWNCNAKSTEGGDPAWYNDRGYCGYKPPKTQAARPAPVAAPAAAPAPSSGNPRLQAASTALMAACTLLHGREVSADLTVAYAATFYHKFLKLAATGDVPAPVPASFAAPDIPERHQADWDTNNPDADIPFS